MPDKRFERRRAPAVTGQAGAAALPILLVLALFVPGLAGTAGDRIAGIPLQPQIGVEPAVIVFESRAPGHTGGGLGISNTHFPGHTFRLLERTEVSALGGGNLSAFGAQSVFAALYRVATPDSTADVVGDSNLLDATLLEVPDGGPNDVTGAVSLTLDPGWYTIVTGTGRHGATAGNTSVFLENTGTATTPQSIGPYSMRSDTNARILQAATTRFFVEGETLDPEPPDESAFLMESAGPAAWWTQGSFGINGTFFRGTRFEITATTRVDEVGAWMRSGSGQVFAALVELDGPGANPPPVTSPSFSDSVVGATLIDAAGPPDAYTGDFDGLELAPGHYALILGSGLFGAGGTAGLMGVTDQIVRPGSLTWTGSFWANSDSDFRFWLKGIVPQLALAPATVDFGDTVIGSGAGQTLTVTNTGSGALVISSIALSGDNPLPFGLDDLAACIATALPPGGECSFTVTYTPAEAGDDTAVVQVFSDGVPSPFEVGLSGTGIVGVPALEFIPDKLGFGAVELGASSPAQTATLHNTGNGDAGALEFTLSGGSFGAVTGDCGDSLGAGQSCVVQVTFTPLAAGPAAATLTAGTGDGVSAGLDLAGTGLEPEVPDLLILPQRVDFGEAGPGEVLTSDFLIIENEDVGTLILVDLLVTGVHAGDFQVTPGVDECSGQQLELAEFCHFTLDFSPLDAGVRRARLRVDSNDPGAPHFVELTGTRDVIFHDGFERPVPDGD